MAEAGAGSGFDKGQGQEFTPFPGDGGAPSRYPLIMSLIFTLACALITRLDNPGGLIMEKALIFKLILGKRINFVR